MSLKTNQLDWREGSCYILFTAPTCERVYDLAKKWIQMVEKNVADQESRQVSVPIIPVPPPTTFQPPQPPPQTSFGGPFLVSPSEIQVDVIPPIQTQIPPQPQPSTPQSFLPTTPVTQPPRRYGQPTQLEQLRQQFESATETINQLQQANNTLTQENNNIRLAFNSADRARQELQQQNNSLQQVNSEYGQTITNLNTRLTTITGQLDQCTRGREQDRQVITDYDQQLNRLTELNRQKDARITELTNLVERYQQDNVRATQIFQQILNKKNEAEAKLNALLSQLRQQ